MSAASLLDRAREGEPLTDLDIVDMHAHIGTYDFCTPAHMPQAMAAAMDRVGVRQIFVSHYACISGRTEAGNDETLAAMRACPGRFLGYVVVWPSSAEAVAKEARRRIAEGFSGIKLHNSNGFPYTEPAYAPALELAHEHCMPVLLHTWGEAEMFAAVRQFSGRYPHANFLLGHSGIVNPEEYGRVAREQPNVYLETCSSLFPMGGFDRLVEAAGAEKVVWGSDCPFINIAHQVGKVLGARCGDSVKRQVLSGNARRILGAIRR